METVPRTLCLSSARTYMKNHRFPQVQYGTTVVHIQERLQGYRQLYACAVSTQLFHTLGSADLQIHNCFIQWDLQIFKYNIPCPLNNGRYNWLMILKMQTHAPTKPLVRVGCLKLQARLCNTDYHLQELTGVVNKARQSFLEVLMCSCS